MRQVAPALPANTVLLTVPFAVSGSTQPMLWQAVDGIHFRLAGAALKTPDALGGPVGSGAPGSARRILTDLTVLGGPGAHRDAGADRDGPPGPASTGRSTTSSSTGHSRDPVYASGFFTVVLGAAPAYEHGAWVWTLQPGGPSTTRRHGGLPVAVPGGRGGAEAAPRPAWPCPGACSSAPGGR